MASNALQGFVQGFAGTLAPVILERKKEARDYFNKQVEYARTKGLENRQRVRQTVDANLSIANQLIQSGVPTEVVMAQINMDPQGLGSFNETAQRLQAAAGRNFTPDEWGAMFKVAGNFKAPNEDIATFISRTYDPIANASSSPGFASDPEGSLMASMMGYTAMDEARAELGKTEIAEGLTADELIRYGDVQPQRIGGNAVVTMNYDAIPTEMGDGEFKTAEVAPVSKFIDEQVDSLITTLQMKGQLSEGDDVTIFRDKILDEMVALYPDKSREALQRLVDRAFINRRFTLGATAPQEAVESPSDVSIGGDSSKESRASEAPPRASVEPLTEEEIAKAKSEFNIANVVDNKDGTVTVTGTSGNTETGSIEEFRAMLRAQ